MLPLDRAVTGCGGNQDEGLPEFGDWGDGKGDSGSVGKRAGALTG